MADPGHLHRACAMDKLMPTVQWGNVFAFPRKWRLGVDLSFQGKGYYQNVYAGRNVYGIDSCSGSRGWGMH